MRRRPVLAGAALALLAAGLAAATVPRPEGAAVHLGSHAWRLPWHGAGGVSALLLEPDGAGFTAVTDRGFWIRGSLARDAAGVVRDVDATARVRIRKSAGFRRLWGGERDAEALARQGEDVLIAFEGYHRVMRHAGGIWGRPTRLGAPADFSALPLNRGIEALATAPDGTLVAVAEAPRLEDGPLQAWRHAGGAWVRAFTLPRRGGFLATAADFGPDGRLYLLERSFWLVGFRSRLRSFDAGGGDERVEFTSRLWAHDNLEGLSVWRDAGGRLRATMVSDDNLRGIQRTEFVDYLLDGGAAGVAGPGTRTAPASGGGG